MALGNIVINETFNSSIVDNTISNIDLHRAIIQCDCTFQQFVGGGIFFIGVGIMLIGLAYFLKTTRSGKNG